MPSHPAYVDLYADMSPRQQAALRDVATAMPDTWVVSVTPTGYIDPLDFSVRVTGPDFTTVGAFASEPDARRLRAFLMEALARTRA